MCALPSHAGSGFGAGRDCGCCVVVIRWRRAFWRPQAPTELQARLSEKLRFLPSAKIRGMAPAGAKTLSGVPIRLDYASKSEWLRALRQTVQCFSKAQKSEDSLKEEGGDLRRVGEHVAGAQWPRDFCPDRSERERPVHGRITFIDYRQHAIAMRKF